jgi:hypothetical protein
MTRKLSKANELSVRIKSGILLRSSCMDLFLRELAWPKTFVATGFQFSSRCASHDAKIIVLAAIAHVTFYALFAHALSFVSSF